MLKLKEQVAFLKAKKAKSLQEMLEILDEHRKRQENENELLNSKESKRS